MGIMREFVRHMLNFFQIAVMGPTARVTIVSLSGIIIVFIIYLALKMVIKNFEPEVSGSIIQGLATVFTVGASLLFSAYTFNRSQRVTLRDEILKKRLELYNDLYVRCKDATLTTMFLLFKEVNDPSVEAQIKKGMESAKKIFDILEKNRFYLSEKVYEIASDASHFATVVLGMIQQNEEELLIEYLMKSLGLPEGEIRFPPRCRSAILKKHYYPLVRQFEKELNLKPIQEDIEKMYRDLF